MSEAMTANGILETVARKLCRKERRASKAHLREIHQSKRGQFVGKMRLRCQRSDKGHVRGPQKKSAAAKARRAEVKVFAGMKRESAEASIDVAGTKALKSACADHPILHPPKQSLASSRKKTKTNTTDANDASALLPSDSD